jgi:hypothetical protein
MKTPEEKAQKKNISKILGYILLSPAILSIPLVMLTLYHSVFSRDVENNIMKPYFYFAGIFLYSEGVPGFVMFAGLLAIAGAYLLKSDKLR